MRKSYSTGLICLLIGLLLAGCGSKGPAANNGASVSPSTSPRPSSSASIQPSAGNTPGQTVSASPSASPAQASEKPAAPEKNPVGDIPDTQAFIKYNSQNGGYSLEVPEGWARTEQGGDVSFKDKLDGLKVAVSATGQAPTAGSVKTGQAAELEKTGRAVKVEKITEVNLPAGKTVKVNYSSNSEPDAVTGKQIRLENEAYYYFNNGQVAVLSLWAPLGADNVDQWQRMSQSFNWSGK